MLRVPRVLYAQHMISHTYVQRKSRQQIISLRGRLISSQLVTRLTRALTLANGQLLISRFTPVDRFHG